MAVEFDPEVTPREVVEIQKAPKKDRNKLYIAITVIAVLVTLTILFFTFSNKIIPPSIPYTVIEYTNVGVPTQ